MRAQYVEFPLMRRDVTYDGDTFEGAANGLSRAMLWLAYYTRAALGKALWMRAN